MVDETKLLAQFVQLFKHWLSDVGLGIIVREMVHCCWVE